MGKKNLICNADSTLTQSWKNKPKVMILKNLGLRARLQRCIPVMCTGCAALSLLLPLTWDPWPVLDLTASEARRGKKDSGGCACACLGRAMQSGASGLLLSIFLGRIDNN